MPCAARTARTTQPHGHGTTAASPPLLYTQPAPHPRPASGGPPCCCRRAPPHAGWTRHLREAPRCAAHRPAACRFKPAQPSPPGWANLPLLLPRQLPARAASCARHRGRAEQRAGRPAAKNSRAEPLAPAPRPPGPQPPHRGRDDGLAGGVADAVDVLQRVLQVLLVGDLHAAHARALDPQRRLAERHLRARTRENGTFASGLGACADV